ncbi:MAG: AMP-binding protein [Gemmatimonas sp.]
MSVAVHSFAFDRFSLADTNSNAVALRGKIEIGELEFRARIDAWRRAFGTITNTSVALYEPDGVEFSAALIGAWYANKIVYLPGDTQPETCLALQALDVAFVGAFPNDFEHVLANSTDAIPANFEALDADDAQVVIFTSGSTGAPQAVPKRFGQLLAEVDALENRFGATIGGSTMVATVSHQHIYGLLFKILWPLSYRRTFVAESLIYPEQLLATLAERKCAIVSGPAHLKRLPETLNWNAAQHHISATFSSGGPLPLAAASSVELLFGKAPFEVYGSSETGGIAYRQCANNEAAPWTPIPGVEVTAQEGQLAVRSRHLPNLEWFLVPDNVSFDVSGHFTLLGRADRIAKIEGKRVSLTGVEDALMKSGLVAEVRVTQLESNRDELGAIVVPNDAGWSVLREEGVRALRARLHTTLAGSVERLAHPRRWRWVDALPVNAVGKTSHSAAVELFAEYGVALPVPLVLQSSPRDATIDLYVSPHLAAFDGHFRKLPVLAGVVQIDWAMLLGRKLFGIQSKFARMEAIKFLRVYQPGPMLHLTMQWNPERQLLAFRFESDQSTHSSGRIFFGG